MNKSTPDDVRENLYAIEEKIQSACARAGRKRDSVRLMAVTKTVDPELVNTAVNCGVTLLGENRVQEYILKRDYYDKRAEVHFIGTLQSNKAKYIVDSVTCVESLSSLSLAAELDRQAKKADKKIDALVEVNIGREESKSGIMPDKLLEFIDEIKKYDNIKVTGLMSIPPVCTEKSEIRKFFYETYKLYVDIGQKKIDNINMSTLSMGMSGDFEEAICEGANIIRIGTALFGKRDYRK